jgi:hypothetical protein
MSHYVRNDVIEQQNRVAQYSLSKLYFPKNAKFRFHPRERLSTLLLLASKPATGLFPAWIASRQSKKARKYDVVLWQSKECSSVIRSKLKSVS